MSWLDSFVEGTGEAFNTVVNGWATAQADKMAQPEETRKSEPVKGTDEAGRTVYAPQPQQNTLTTNHMLAIGGGVVALVLVVALIARK